MTSLMIFFGILAFIFSMGITGIYQDTTGRSNWESAIIFIVSSTLFLFTTFKFATCINNDEIESKRIQDKCNTLCDYNKMINCIGYKNNKFMVICADKELGQKLIAEDIK